MAKLPLAEEVRDDLSRIDFREFREIGMQGGGKRHPAIARHDLRRFCEGKNRGDVQDVMVTDLSGEADVKWRQVSVPGALLKPRQTCGAKMSLHSAKTHVRTDSPGRCPVAEEIDRQIESVGKGKGAVCKMFPASDVPAGLGCSLEVEEGADRNAPHDPLQAASLRAGSQIPLGATVPGSIAGMRP